MAIGVLGFRQGMNLIQSGLFRGPAVLASALGVAHVGELAMRGLTNVAFYAGMNVSAPDKGSMKEKILNTIRPYREVPVQDVLIRGLALVVIGIVGFHLAGLVFGPAPLEIYNGVLPWIGPLRLSNDMHPLFEMASKYFWPV